MTKEEEIEEQKKAFSSEARKQQAEASDPAFSVWVEASAGTGKTKVLSDRVFRLLLSGVEPSKVLCLTYTRAAAVEMNTRIQEALSKWAVCSEEDLEKEIKELYNDENILQKQPDLMSKARQLFACVLDAVQPIKIQTLHGFCEDILKRFPLEAKVSPYFEVMDERLTSEILDQISQKLIKELETTNDEQLKSAVSFLVKNMGETSWKDVLQKIVQQRHKMSEMFSGCNLETFLKNLEEKFHLQKDPTIEAAIARFEKEIDRESIKKCAQYLLEGERPTDQERGAALAGLLERFNFDEYASLLITKKDSTYKSRETLACKDVVEKHPEVDLILRAEAARVICLIDEIKGIKVYEATKAVGQIASRLIEEYNAYKSARARMDYDDLIVATKNLLEQSGVSAWVLYKLDGGIEHVLIDEAQDTSPNQWAIVNALTSDFFSGEGQTRANRTIFAVGDRKQSIFGFQGAEPKCFEEMEDKYKKSIGKKFKPVKLEFSFRSVEAVLATVNYLFSLPDAISGVADGGSKVNHKVFRLGEGGTVEILPLTLYEKEEDEEDVWELPVYLKSTVSPISKLAFQIACKIKDMVESGEMLASKGRPLQYKDFMVLVRRRNPFMKEFVRACKIKGVEITGVDRLKLLDEIVIKDLLALAEFLLLPTNDLSLACVLKSPLYGLNDDDLFELCYERGGLCLWQRLSSSEKYKDIREEIQSLLKAAESSRPYEIFNMVLNTFKGKRRFYARFGAECKDPIDEFMNLALSFEREHVPNLQNFMTWIYEGDVEIKREMEQESINAVRLMTAHSSKGLQAPIVILPDTTTLPPTDRGSGLIFDDKLFYYPLSADDYNICCNEVHKKRVDKELDEYRRLLYVALTRAEDRLYIAGFQNAKPKKNKKEKKEEDKKPKNWYELCHDALDVLGVKTPDAEAAFGCLQEIEPKEKKKKALEIVCPSEAPWVDEKIVNEGQKKLSKPYSPSHMEDDDETPVASPLEDEGAAYRRGTLIHRLLQLLGSGLSADEQADFVKKYLQKEKDLSQKTKESIEKEVLDLLSSKEFAFIFEGDSRAEVPLMGEVDGKIISGQIDRLVVTNDKVYVIDFKTNRPAVLDREKVYPQYVTQLDVYKKLLSRIYPGKQIETYILWTNVLKLMKI